MISALDTDLNAAIARKADLEKAEDKAIFGDGDLAKVRAAISNCNSEIGLLEKAIEGADARRIEAAKNEAAADIGALGKHAKAKAAELSKRWRRVYELIEEMRPELFECDALKRSIGAANNTFEGARRSDLMINLNTIRREAMSGPRARTPDRLSTPAVEVDKVLVSFLTLGGMLDPRARARRQVQIDAIEIKAAGHHPQAEG
ncbi:hypothetical protein [Mesorhizobium sp. M0220]|uniref:hypothetical protein n=1 Tax=Mesorhizobium sp. M0220 TaxID=2956920 RepID=UPI003336F0FA